ncbi:MAG: TolC family protein [Verrucomicrobiae bacterium]|nr:TolC family protein [Verrucomicrobiae bacterium]
MQGLISIVSSARHLPGIGRNVPFPPLCCLMVLLLISACATPVKTKPSPPVDPPAAWKAVPYKHDPVQTGWLSQFKSEDLEKIVVEAMNRNLDLQIAAARLESARAGVRGAASALYPKADAGASQGRSQTFDPNRGTDSYGLTMNISWEIDLWGRLRAGKGAAMAVAESSRFNLEASRLSLAAQTAKAWFAAIEAQEQVRIASENLDISRRTTLLVDARYKGGAVSAFDFKLTSAQEKQSEEALVQRRQNFEEAKRTLELVLARYPAASIEVRKALPSMPAEIPVGLPSDLLMRRPDLLSAEWQLFASENRVFSARAERLPKLALTGSGGTSSNELEKLLDERALVASIVGNLTQPVFRAGEIQSRIEQQEAAQKEAAAEYAKLVLTAFSEVENSLAREAFLKQREALQAEALTQFEEAFLLARERYKAGQIDIIALLDTQRSSLNARSLLLATQRARLDNRADLMLALGGGF